MARSSADNPRTIRAIACGFGLNEGALDKTCGWQVAPKADAFNEHFQQPTPDSTSTWYYRLFITSKCFTVPGAQT
jgi:hypothetical protein